MRKLLLIVSLFVATGSAAQELTPLDRTSIYRRSFTARYELTGEVPVREAALSPDSTKVGFVRDNDLFLRDIATGVETRLTSDGERNHIINGATDWVYEEEYAFTRAWEWSPDGRSIAWLRFDETLVPEFSMMRYDGGLYPAPYTFKYPKAGEANSVVTLHVYDLEDGLSRQVETGAETDQYIPRIGWTPAGQLFFYRVNRLQNRFEVVLGDGRVIYDESSPTYVERPDENTVTFQPDGRHFVVRNETRTGRWEEYLYSVEGGFVESLSVDAEKDVAPLGIDYWNERVARGEITDGREFFSFPNDDGVELFGWMLKPEGFDPARKHPVFMTQYSGPGSRSVCVERIGAGDMSIYRPLLDAGYIVACVDPRGTGGRGEAFKKSTYGALGKLETEDQIAAARWLAQKPWVDSARIGIYGWSYGGFIALNSVLKGADVFAAAVAVAPVTSWRFYDTIYTEIYNGLPSQNPAGYDNNSPINYAGLLQGRLLLVHGTGDDNVHVQNSYEMARALVAADRRFDMMIYPDDNHSMRPSGSTHIRQKIVAWVLENL
ncbi:MAG: DPP IV N-terminal domain-containing protein [Alistipes sp.]|nr:DPP IV N-terminal domain-containing protein [Alistipes sp.]